MSIYSIFSVALALYCSYWPARYLEQLWGSLRVNLYYLIGILAMDVYAMLVYFLFHVSYGVSALYLNRRASAPKQQPNPNWAQNYQNRAGERPYRHKCLVCGRTDTEYPDLEFRYCSKCKGYCCYCIDHINNHVHIQ